MQVVSVAEAREKLAQLLRAVEQGQEVVIRRYSRPIARLVPYEDGGVVFPDLSAFRSAQKDGSISLADLRNDERY